MKSGPYRRAHRKPSPRGRGSHKKQPAHRTRGSRDPAAKQATGLPSSRIVTLPALIVPTLRRGHAARDAPCPERRSLLSAVPTQKHGHHQKLRPEGGAPTKKAASTPNPWEPRPRGEAGHRPAQQPTQRTLIVPTLRRGHAARDAPRPERRSLLSAVPTQKHGHHQKLRPEGGAPTKKAASTPNPWELRPRGEAGHRPAQRPHRHAAGWNSRTLCTSSPLSSCSRSTFSC